MNKLSLFLCLSSLCFIIQASTYYTICQEPKKVGPCRAAFPKWYFNQELSKCEEFIYGGCQANGNNFGTYNECSAACEPKVFLGEGAVRDTPILCKLQAETGMCRAYFPRYYYNLQSGQCEKFVWGGCGGNANNFEDEASCLNTCRA